MKLNSILFILVFTILSLAISCNKDEAAAGTDLDLLNFAKETTGWTYFENSNTYLNKSSGSGHKFDKLRTRYNAIAATQLDTIGRIKDNAIFADGSLIVKDLTDDTHHVERYAILYKKAGHPDADAKGWVWGYVNADGTVSTPASDKGKICINCHSQSGSIDYTLMNKFF